MYLYTDFFILGHKNHRLWMTVLLMAVSRINKGKQIQDKDSHGKTKKAQQQRCESG